MFNHQPLNSGSLRNDMALPIDTHYVVRNSRKGKK